MFENNKYTTKEVAENIPLHLQNILWYLIETMEVSQKDYLQEFELRKVNENGRVLQKLLILRSSLSIYTEASERQQE